MSRFPFVVVDRVRHKRPRNAGIRAHTDAENGKRDDIEHERRHSVLYHGEDEHQYAAENGNEGTDDGNFLFAELVHEFFNKGHKEHHGDKPDCRRDARELRHTEMNGEHDGICRSSRLHTEEHRHSGDRRTDGGAVFQEVLEGFPDVEFLRVVDFDRLLVHADRDGFEHEHKGDEPKHAHDQSGEEDVFADQFLRLYARFFVDDGVAACVREFFPNERGQDHHGDHVPDDRADGAPRGKLGAFEIVLGDQGEHGAVGHVRDRVEGVPNDVADDIEQDFYPKLCLRYGNETQRSRHQKPGGADEYVGLELAVFILPSVCVDHASEQGVVDGIPDLHDQQQYRQKPGVQHHVHRPEGGQSALQCEAHVAAEVACRISEFIPYPEGAGLFFCGFHKILLIFPQRND